MTEEFPPDLDWGDQLARGAVYAERRAVRLGLRVTGNDAKGIASEALEQIIAAGWNRHLYPEFADCLASRINGILMNRVRKKATRQEVASDHLMPAAADPARSPEQVAADRQLAGRATTRMLERLDGNAVATMVFMAMAEGADRPAEIAGETGIPIGQVYRARERISAVSAEVAAELMMELEP